MFTHISQFAPDQVEAGTGLALQTNDGRYLFFIAGTRHHCPPGEIFYAGIGGHREKDENWEACAKREALEEIGAEISLLSCKSTWYLPHNGGVERIFLSDQIKPFALYEMIHPENTPRAGEIYRIVIYRALLCGELGRMPPDEIGGVIALTLNQICRGVTKKYTLNELLDDGASILAGGDQIDKQIRLYPIGTALALANILKTIKDEDAQAICFS